MKDMKKIVLFIALVSGFLLTGCYKDTAEKPDASFEVYVLDSLDNEIYMDTVKVGQEVYYRSTGTGEYFVAWPGEKRINLSGYSYTFTQEGLEGLANQFVPDSVIDSLQTLVGKTFDSDSKASNFIFRAIGGGSNDDIIWDTYFTYEYQIKVSAVTLNPDSTYFKYNHNYEDFKARFDNGFYNINGIAIEYGKKQTKYIYKLPGIYKVYFVARGIEEFGASALEDFKMKEIVVKPNI